MTFRSAKEDLEATTLAALRGTLAQLDYLAALRPAEGGYEHWGLTKVHGKEAAEEALAAAHREAFTRLLRQPLERTCAEQETLERVVKRSMEELLPAGTDELQRRHFSLVWDAMTSVARRRRKRLPAA
ncbi:MAG TPA: hypothetical protein VLA96_03240 [Terriglobales bacterium]|jgi:hypothetical protein|nr:hypothetical protein [Terriglobales bacterium]